MTKYSTQQRKTLLFYLSKHPDELLSTQQIADALQKEKISLSAVYRNLSALESEGKVRRCSRTGTRELFYQYMDAEPCKGVLHMTCIRCGKTLHMTNENANLLMKQLKVQEQFQLDLMKTVLFGICKDCIDK